MLNTDFAIGFGMVYVYLPLMVLPIYASMEKLDFRMVEAATISMRAAGGAAADHHPLVNPASSPAHPGLHPAHRRLRHARAARRWPNMMVSNLISLQFGQGRNWPLGRALHHVDGDRDGRADDLCPQRSRHRRGRIRDIMAARDQPS
jgi:spermidine/putrescine transport system permease protein